MLCCFLLFSSIAIQRYFSIDGFPAGVQGHSRSLSLCAEGARGECVVPRGATGTVFRVMSAVVVCNACFVDLLLSTGQ